MNAVMRLVRRYPLVAFFVLAYAIAWSFWPFGSFGAFGALIAALVVASLTRGRAGLRELGARLIRWRVGWLWWALAIGVPLGVHALTDVMVDVTGGERPTTTLTTALLAFALRLVNPADGALAEEPAWRGYAQPVAQGQGRTPLATATVFGVLIAGWHLPLFFLEVGRLQADVLVYGLVTTMAVTYWYTWLFNRSGGSSLLPLVAHNVEGLLPAGSWVYYTAVWVALALVLILADRRRWLTRAPAAATTRAEDPAEPLPANRSGRPEADSLPGGNPPWNG